MNDKPAFWFPVKRYGWGWGLPVCWQGWLVFLGYLALIFGGLRYFTAERVATSGALIYCAVVTIAFIVIVVVKGERPAGWRWGQNTE